MKTTYFLKLEIELAELQVKLANHRLDKHYAMEKEQFEQAADTRKWENEIKTHIRSLIEGAIYTFTYHVQKEDRKIYRPQLERFLAQANLAIQAQTTTLPDPEQSGLTDTIPKLQLPKPNISYQEKDPAEELNRHINPANLAFQEHFSHIFTQLTALHEKMMEEERFIEAKNVMDQCMSVAVYIQTWGEERW